MKKYKEFELVTLNLLKVFGDKSVVNYNQFLKGKSGSRRQIDILIETYIATFPVKVIVDCKYLSSKVDIKKVEEVIGLVDDVDGSLGVIVSNSEYTQGAVDRSNTYGRLQLCSILDMEKPDFSIKIFLPAVCEFQYPTYSLQLKSTDNNLSIPVDAKDLNLVHSDGHTSSLVKEFLSKWNKGEVNRETGIDEIFPIDPENWKVVGIKGPFNFTELNLKYTVNANYYTGSVPIIRGKGIVDVKSRTLTTQGFEISPIDTRVVEKTWRKYSNKSELQEPWTIWLVASNTYPVED